MSPKNVGITIALKAHLSNPLETNVRQVLTAAYTVDLTSFLKFIAIELSVCSKLHLHYSWSVRWSASGGLIEIELLEALKDTPWFKAYYEDMSEEEQEGGKESGASFIETIKDVDVSQTIVRMELKNVL